MKQALFYKFNVCVKYVLCKHNSQYIFSFLMNILLLSSTICVWAFLYFSFHRLYIEGGGWSCLNYLIEPMRYCLNRIIPFGVLIHLAWWLVPIKKKNLIVIISTLFFMGSLFTIAYSYITLETLFFDFIWWL